MSNSFVTVPLTQTPPVLTSDYLESSMLSSTCILLLTPASCYSLCAWSNPAFQKVFGWTFEDTVGLEMFFMHGDAANLIPLARKLREVESSLSSFECSQHCYTHSGLLLKCSLKVAPVMESNIDSFKAPQVSFIQLTFSNIVEAPFPVSLFSRTFEIGLPIDRREYCKSYSNYYGPAVDKNNIQSIFHFDKFCKHASITNVMSLMMATSSIMLICNR